MMSFGPTRLFVSMLASFGTGAICAAAFPWFPAAWAQSVPADYVEKQEGDVLVMRPSAATDPDITIRIYPPFDGDGDSTAVAHQWAESHPLPGVNAGAVNLQDKSVNGMSCLFRIWVAGTQPQIELILMPKDGAGRYRAVIGRLPSQPGPLVSSQSQAMAHVAALIQAGQFQSDITPDGKGKDSTATSTAESTGKGTPSARTAQVPALLRAIPVQTQGATGLVARSTKEIETMGFMTRGQTGVGGMWIFVPKPVALFRGGDALLEIGNLNRATSLEADRAAHPSDWSRWRRTAGGIEVSQGDKWKKLDYNKTMQRLSVGFALSGVYKHLGGGGNTAVGGPSSLVAQATFTFQPDGRFSSNRYVGFSFNDENAPGPYKGATVQSQGPIVGGRYHVDGYLLRLEPAGGPPESHIIATYPTDPNIIWIDGQGYTRAAH